MLEKMACTANFLEIFFIYNKYFGLFKGFYGIDARTAGEKTVLIGDPMSFYGKLDSMLFPFSIDIIRIARTFQYKVYIPTGLVTLDERNFLIKGFPERELSKELILLFSQSVVDRPFNIVLQ